jgi:hypothetical protein
MQSQLRSNASFLSTIGILLIAAFAAGCSDLLRADIASDKKPAETAATSESNPRASRASELPFDVRFERGETHFENGDKITILEVRGTADTVTFGNIYWIRGTYKLTSHDEAILSTGTTAADTVNGRYNNLKIQDRLVKKGEGEFKLFLVMPFRGWPHVSYYPAKGGNGFGGVYFGTAESLHK